MIDSGTEPNKKMFLTKTKNVHLNFDKLQTKMLDYTSQRVQKSSTDFLSNRFQGFERIDSGYGSKSRKTFQIRQRIFWTPEKLQNKTFDFFQRVPRPGISTALKHISETKCIETAKDGHLQLNNKLTNCYMFEVG